MRRMWPLCDGWEQVESNEIGRVVYELEQEHLRGTTGCIRELRVPVKNTGYKWELQVPAKMYRIQK